MADEPGHRFDGGQAAPDFLTVAQTADVLQIGRSTTYPTVADTYEREGRLHGGTAEQIERAAVSAWWRHRKAGESTLLMAPSNETVDRLNQAAQRRRIAAGELADGECFVLPNGVRLHVGDEIATRHNDRTLETDRHEMVRNRNTWTITALNDDWTITARGSTGTVVLPAEYLCDHVELAYAITAMGAQGRTVDHAITVIDGVTDVRNLYVPMTRGRDSNRAYLTTVGEEAVADVFARYLTNDWIDLPAHQRARELWALIGREPDFRTPAVARDDDFGIDL